MPGIIKKFCIVAFIAYASSAKAAGVYNCQGERSRSRDIFTLSIESIPAKVDASKATRYTLKILNKTDVVFFEEVSGSYDPTSWQGALVTLNSLPGSASHLHGEWRAYLLNRPLPVTLNGEDYLFCCDERCW